MALLGRDFACGLQYILHRGTGITSKVVRLLLEQGTAFNFKTGPSETPLRLLSGYNGNLKSHDCCLSAVQTRMLGPTLTLIHLISVQFQRSLLKCGSNPSTRNISG
jgi:hypothetical protein